PAAGMTAPAIVAPDSDAAGCGAAPDGADGVIGPVPLLQAAPASATTSDAGTHNATNHLLITSLHSVEFIVGRRVPEQFSREFSRALTSGNCGARLDDDSWQCRDRSVIAVK